MTKSVKLSQKQKVIKLMYTPKPPEGLCGNALNLFNTAITKITFTPCDNNGLSVSYEKLSKEELFALGISGTDEWPISIPDEAKNATKNGTRKRNFFGANVYLPAIEQDHCNTNKENIESLRNTILVTKHGEKFKPQRIKGSKSKATKHIEELVKANPGEHAKVLEGKADKNIIGEMASGTFYNKVSEARTRLKLEGEVPSN